MQIRDGHLTKTKREMSTKWVGNGPLTVRATSWGAGVSIKLPKWDGGETTLFLTDEEAKALRAALESTMTQAEAARDQDAEGHHRSYRSFKEVVPEDIAKWAEPQGVAAH